MKDKQRIVSLHKHLTKFDGVVWQIELDGVNTGVGFTQEFIDDLPSSQRCGMIEEIVTVWSDTLAEKNFTLTETEKARFNKLLQCLS